MRLEAGKSELGLAAMGAFQTLLLAALLAVTGAVPVKQSPQPSMLDQFGPPPKTQQAEAASGDENQQWQSAGSELADWDSPGQTPTCPQRSRCVPASQCSSADVITYEQPQDIYHPESQYDRQTFTPRFTCGQSAPDYVCCREEGVLPYHATSQGNPFGFPDSLGGGSFHHDPAFGSGFGSASGSGSGSSSASGSSSGASFGSGSASGFGSVSGVGSESVSGSAGNFQQGSTFDSVSGFGSGSTSGSFSSGSSSFVTGSNFGSNFGSSPGLFSPDNSDFTPDTEFSSGASSGFSSGSGTEFNSGAGLDSAFGLPASQELSSSVGSGVGVGSGPSGGPTGSFGSSSGLPDSSSAFAGFGGTGFDANFATQGLDVRQDLSRPPGPPNFGVMFPPGMPPLGPGMPPPGMGIPPRGPVMFPPGAGDFPPPGAFPSRPASFPSGSPGSSATSGFSSNADGLTAGQSFLDPSTGSFTPGGSVPTSARRRLQQVLIRGQQHILPEFSSALKLDGGAEAFSTHSTLLESMEVRPVPGFTRTGRSQTVLVSGRPHVTGEFVFVSDPSRQPIIVTTEGVPGQFETEGGEQANEFEPFIPLPELVMLAADIFRQIGGTISQQGASTPDVVPFEPPPPPTISTSLRPPAVGPAPSGPASFGGGPSGSFGGVHSGAFGSGQPVSLGDGQTASFSGTHPGFGGAPPTGSSFPDEDSYISFEGESSHSEPSFGGPHSAPGQGHEHGQGHGHGPGHGKGHGHGHGHRGPSLGHGPPPPYGHGHHQHRPHHRRRPPPYSLRHGYSGHRRPLLPPPRFHGPFLPHQIISPVPAFTETCGRRGQLSGLYESVFGAYSARISSGFGLEPGVADYGSHPWHAAILRRTSPHDPRGHRLGGLQYICGATLVSEDMLVTAAHCVQAEREGDLVVRLGEYNLYSDREELYKPYDGGVRAIHVHPDYRSAVYLADIAVLQLAAPVPLASLPHVTPACLPGPDLSGDHVTCEAPGWGYDAYKTQLEEAPHALKAVAVRPTPPDACEASLQATVLGADFHLQPGSFCAVGSHGQDTCLGDGGGGLVCPRVGFADDPPQFQLVGVTSWGVRCGDGTPGVYTNVATYRPWIETILESSRSLPTIVPIAVPYF